MNNEDISAQINEINQRLLAIEEQIKELLSLVKIVVAPSRVVIGF